MKRREALKTLGIATAGLITLPGWATGWSKETVAHYKSDFTTEEQTLLSAVSDTIIPEKEGIGAVPLGVDKFLVRLFDECYEEDIRASIKLQLAELNKRALNSAGQPFSDCSQAQRKKNFLTFENSENESEKQFFQLVKSETIRGFRTSKVVMQDYLGYRVAPGRYNGNVDVEA